MSINFHLFTVDQDILILVNLEQKIIPSVLNLCVEPIGAPSEIMMTMTTLMANPITPRSSPNQTTSNRSSFILKELTDANLSIHCCGNECSPSSNILRKTPTSIFQEPNATATVNLLNDDDDKTPHTNN